MRLWFLLVVLVSFAAAAGEQCATPRLHDTGPLAIAAAQDTVLGQAFQKAAQACSERSEACERARMECTQLLSAVARKQIGVDEGMWLRDLLLPYLGQQYPVTRPFGAFVLASDASCGVDVSSLITAGQRRLGQASRREMLLAEYERYARWVEGAQKQCQRRLAGPARAAPEQAVIGAGAAAALEARRLAEDAAREDVRRAQDAAAARAREDWRRREELEALARRGRIEQEARARETQEANRRREAEEQARRAEEERALHERTLNVTQARAERARLLAEAEMAYEAAAANEEAKRRAAVEAVSVNPLVAQGAVEEAALAAKAREQAERNLAEAKFKAERIEIDDSFERSRGHLGLLVGGGATGFRDASDSSSTAPAIGALVTAHLGFWSPAPLLGLASGFEVAIGARVFKPFAGGASPLEFEGHVTARYFFGALGAGVAGEFRVADSAFGVRPFGAGVSLAVALVDTPDARVMLSGNWLPVGVAVDLARVTGELEASWGWFTFRVTGGSFTQHLSSNTPIGWQGAVFAGARLTL